RARGLAAPRSPFARDREIRVRFLTLFEPARRSDTVRTAGRVYGMKRRGRPRAATVRERERVLALAEEGFSQRSIAERVFGDRRLRGRGERILRRARSRDASLDAELESLVDRLD